MRDLQAHLISQAEVNVHIYLLIHTESRSSDASGAKQMKPPASQASPRLFYLSLLFPGCCSPALPPLLLLVLYCIHIHFPPILLQLGGRVSHDR